jgi:hypothetical protein
VRKIGECDAGRLIMIVMMRVRRELSELDLTFLYTHVYSLFEPVDTSPECPLSQVKLFREHLRLLLGRLEGHSWTERRVRRRSQLSPVGKKHFMHFITV